jgi:serine protease Do
MIDLAAIAASIAPAVVGVTAAHGRHRRAGTGTVIAEGTVVTTAHNLAGSHVTLHLHDGSRVAGTVAGASEDLDLAVVTADLPGIAPASWGDPTAVGIGADVVAIAAPDGVARITAGAVATLGSRVRTRTGSPVDGVLEHSAPLVRGASGGPVLDASGAVVAIDLNRLEGGLYQAVLATPALRAAIEGLADGRVPEPRRLGVTVTPDRKARWLREAAGLAVIDGVLVAEVAEGSAADRAGLRRGDLLTALDGAPLRGPDDLLLALRRAPVSVEVALITGGVEPRTATITFEDAASPA